MTQVSPPKAAVVTVLLAHEPLRQSLDVLAKGGRIGVYSGSLQRLFSDMKVLRPSMFGSTPTFWEGLYQSYLAELKEANRRSGETAKPAEVERQLADDWRARNLFGNRCRVGLIGGAKSSPQLKEWMFQALGMVVMDGYGTTETGGLAGNQSVHSSSQLILVDYPELGYTSASQPPRYRYCQSSFPRSPLFVYSLQCQISFSTMPHGLRTTLGLKKTLCLLSLRTGEGRAKENFLGLTIPPQRRGASPHRPHDSGLLRRRRGNREALLCD